MKKSGKSRKTMGMTTTNPSTINAMPAQWRLQKNNNLKTTDEENTPKSNLKQQDMI